MSESWDNADIEFVWLWWMVVGGVQSHFHVKPNFGWNVVELGFWQKLSLWDWTVLRQILSTVKQLIYRLFRKLAEVILIKILVSMLNPIGNQDTMSAVDLLINLEQEIGYKIVIRPKKLIIQKTIRFPRIAWVNNFFDTIPQNLKNF